MTTDQKNKLDKIIILHDTATMADLQEALSSEVVVLSSKKEASLFVEAYRVVQRNSGRDEKGEDISFTLTPEFQEELTFLRKGNDFIQRFDEWLKNRK